MSRSQPVWAVAACVAAVVVLSACSDSSSDASKDAATQSLADFRAAAEPICRKVSTLIAEIEPPHTFPAELEDFDRGSRKILGAITKPYAQLAALAAPAGHEAGYKRFATALTNAVAEEEQVRRLVEEGNDDTDALWLPQTNVSTHQSQAMNEAEKLGLEHCTELSFKEGHH